MCETFGERLRRLRKSKGLNQTQLANQVGVSLLTLFRWEKSERSPRVEEIKALAQALGVSEADLLHDTPEKSGEWILCITAKQELKEEVIDLAKPIPEICTIITANTGAYIALGGSYELFSDDALFKGLIAQLKKMREGVIQQGKATGAISADSKKTR